MWHCCRIASSSPLTEACGLLRADVQHVFHRIRPRVHGCYRAKKSRTPRHPACVHSALHAHPDYGCCLCEKSTPPSAGRWYSGLSRNLKKIPTARLTSPPHIYLHLLPSLGGSWRLEKMRASSGGRSIPSLALLGFACFASRSLALLPPRWSAGVQQQQYRGRDTTRRHSGSTGRGGGSMHEEQLGVGFDFGTR